MSGARHQVYLVPGFFGFSSLGKLNYFRGVRELLTEALGDLGVDAEVIECRTRPTGSITRRAAALVETVAEHGGHQAESLHFVGHSTGGLDIRLLVSPGVHVSAGSVENEIAARTRSVTTVSTPHHGTPLAGFFTTFQGRHLLQLLAVLANSQRGRQAMFAGSQLLSLVARIDDRLGRDRTLLDSLSEKLLRRMTLDPKDPIWRYLDEVASDQGAVIQLTPESMHLFAAAVPNRLDVRYGSVVTASPAPFSRRPRAVFSPARASQWAVYSLLHRICSREHRHYPYPDTGPALERRFADETGLELDTAANDGVVPALSQAHGEVILTVLADHLDIVGQYYTEHDGPVSDWLPSGSRFGCERFEKCWRETALFMVNALT